MTKNKAIEIIRYHKALVDRDKSGLLDKSLEYEAIDMAIKALEQSSDCKIFGHKENCIACAEQHEKLAKWLKQLKEIKRILDAPSYKENGVTYSYCYDSDTKLKHIREVILND